MFWHVFLFQGSFGGLTRYTAWYRFTDSQEWRTVTKPNDDEYEITIENLQPGREYEFMILGHNADGDGVFSIPYRYLTLRRSIDSYQSQQIFYLIIFFFAQHETSMTLNNSETRRGLILSPRWVHLVT